MGGLKPIGSEKLQGTDKLKRIMEIARYKENIPQPINEDKSTEYSVRLADGKSYRIDKEKNGYVIKKQISESTDFDYVEPMKNRKYYSSYSQAFKRLNLIAKEVNLNEGYNNHVSLFEGETDEAKYYLKFGKKGEHNEQAPAAPAPAPAPVPAPAPMPAPAPEETPMPDDMDLDMDMEEPEMDMEDEDEVVTYKMIQKLTGKLAQKIRSYLADDENDMPSKDIKYIINSVLSALNLEDLEEEDLEDIMDKLEGSEDEMDDELGIMDDDMGGEEMEPEAPEVPQAEPEMAEGFDFEMDDFGPEVMPRPGIKPEVEPGIDPDTMPNPDYDPFQDPDPDDAPEAGRRRGRRFRKIHHDDLSDDDSFAMEDMFENIFSESKVDAVLDKYFKNNKKVIKEGKKELIKESQFDISNRLSESSSQKMSSGKLLEKYPNAKLVGKTINNHLVFEVNENKIKVSPKGGYSIL